MSSDVLTEQISRGKLTCFLPCKYRNEKETLSETQLPVSEVEKREKDAIPGSIRG